MVFNINGVHHMPIKPIRDKILVKPNPTREVSAGGIIIPESSKDAPVEGTVISVGGGMIAQNGSNIPLCVNAGDIVLYKKHHQGSEVEMDGETLLLMSEMDILAVIE
jgi:chaperonin GroES